MNIDVFPFVYGFNFFQHQSEVFSVQFFFLTSWLNLFLTIWFLNAIPNGIVFLISFLNYWLVVYRVAVDVCVLILYPAILLNSFINFKVFRGVFRVFSLFSIMSSSNTDSFASFFRFVLLLFYCLITVIRNSNARLNKGWEWAYLDTLVVSWS